MTNWSSKHPRIYEEIDFESVVDFKPKEKPVFSAFKKMCLCNCGLVLLLTLIYIIFK